MGDDNGESYEFFSTVMEDDPAGQTPICAHISDIVTILKSIEGDLRSNNQRAAVIIATDGEATDGNITEALRPLEKLPVWLVIRLCTDEKKVVNYWNQIDKQLEVEVDVIDDFVINIL